jgi:hypothetical protein
MRSICTTPRPLTREALHLELLAQGSALAVSIHLGNNNFVLGMSKRVREFFVLWCEVFAVTANAHVIGKNIRESLRNVPPGGEAGME